MESYSKSEAAPPVFDLSGGHPALDLVNTLDDRFAEAGPVELLTDYGGLLRFAQQTELLQPGQVRLLTKSVRPQAAAGALRSARELREALAAAFYGSLERRPPPDPDVRTLERHFLAAQQHRQLQWREAAARNGQAGMAWRWGRFEKEAELPVWILAQQAAQLVLSDSMQRVRACGADTCRWLFLDTSKNHTRRWCNMRICGNRVKARRFQARRAAEH
jgi:predicted RNA-binding Zn ribbon-like protein